MWNLTYPWMGNISLQLGSTSLSIVKPRLLPYSRASEKKSHKSISVLVNCIITLSRIWGDKYFFCLWHKGDLVGKFLTCTVELMYFLHYT